MRGLGRESFSRRCNSTFPSCRGMRPRAVGFKPTFLIIGASWTHMQLRQTIVSSVLRLLHAPLPVGSDTHSRAEQPGPPRPLCPSYV